MSVRATVAPIAWNRCGGDGVCAVDSGNSTATVVVGGDGGSIAIMARELIAAAALYCTCVVGICEAGGRHGRSAYQQ